MNLNDTTKKITLRTCTRSACEALLDVMCPKKCIVCDCLINLGKLICLCDTCKSLAGKQGRVVGNNDTAYEEVVSALEYDKGIRDAMMRYKFNGKRYLHHTFSWAIRQKIQDRAFMKEMDFICPVPIHPMRDREYNQSMLIASDISAWSGIEVIEDLLLKIKNIKPLSTMSYVNRRIFIRGSIDFNIKYDIFGKNILLVDDIFTTGSTIAECSRILKMYGAEKVYAVSACYALPEKTDPGAEDDNEGGTANAYANLFTD